MQGLVDAPFVSPRYRILAALGEGAMGAVYHAFDRLNDHTVALKRVLLTPDPTTDSEGSRLALTNEFRTLAGLRHPHIISVLDYGFDATLQPFFTMELLEGPQTILAAGRALPREHQVDLLIQVLEALAYLHRRGVLHHDLKPENILYAAGQTRLLDFGLAVLSSQVRDDDAFGTLLYLAPEVLDAQPYTEAADLYSLGVIAYELLVGSHPFPAETVSDYFDQVFTADPDLTPLADQSALAEIIGALLAKQPADRPVSAQAAIAHIQASMGYPPLAASTAIRESYLQAAAFVGRTAELATLRNGLVQAQKGKGSAWLVGGESGAGKSRLLDELRAEALVAGITVVRGQAVEGGGLPYQLWREPLRLLVRSSELSDLEAGVLKPLIPDVAIMLERAVPDAPALSGSEYGQRLMRVIIDLLRRQAQPLLLLLEDVQWADDSLSLLGDVIRLLIDRPVIIIGSYRSEERPDLPEALPGSQALFLNRLQADAIAELSTAMLGEAGRNPQLLDFIARETEGNTFFMVEVVRALAEESGGLSEVGRATLPTNIFTGGVEQLVRRRLRQIPPDAYGLVQLAALLGRQVDRAALRTVLADEALEHWLVACAAAQVLEADGEGWRFAHDKLRAGALIDIAPEQRTVLHRQAAAAIEQAYTASLAPQAGRLADHYRQAGDGERERHYARQAGAYAASVYVHDDAIRHYRRALELAEAPREQFELLLALEEVHDWRGDREAQATDLDALVTLAEQLRDDRCRVEVALRQVRQAFSIGNLPTALAQAAETLPRVQGLADAEVEVRLRLLWGMVLARQSDYVAARAQLTPCLELARVAQLQGPEIDCLNFLGVAAIRESHHSAGRERFEQALRLSRTLRDRRREAQVILSLSVSASLTGDHTLMESYVLEALRLNRLVGRPDAEGQALMNLGVSADAQGDYDRAVTHYDEALRLAHLVKNQFLACQILINWGDVALKVGDLPAAQQLLAQGLQLAEMLDARDWEYFAHLQLCYLELERAAVEQAAGHADLALRAAEAVALVLEQQQAWIALGWVALWRGDAGTAVAAFQSALDRQAQPGATIEAIGAWGGLARVALGQGMLDAAAGYVTHILEWLATQGPGGIYDVMNLYLTCYRVLAVQRDPQASKVLGAGYQELQRRAAAIGDPLRRQTYLTQIRSHRELLAAWHAR